MTRHSLRHFFASLLIRPGESVEPVQARLRHAAETLETYSHLWADSDDRTRAAVDSFSGHSPPPDGRSGAAPLEMAEAYLFKAVAIREAACRLRRSARRVGTLRLEDPELLPGDRRRSVVDEKDR